MHAALWGSQDGQHQFHTTSISINTMDIQLSEKLKWPARFIDLQVVLYTCKLIKLNPFFQQSIQQFYDKYKSFLLKVNSYFITNCEHLKLGEPLMWSKLAG